MSSIFVKECIPSTSLGEVYNQAMCFMPLNPNDTDSHTFRDSALRVLSAVDCQFQDFEPARIALHRNVLSNLENFNKDAVDPTPFLSAYTDAIELTGLRNSEPTRSQVQWVETLLRVFDEETRYDDQARQHLIFALKHHPATKMNVGLYSAIRSETLKHGTTRRDLKSTKNRQSRSHTNTESDTRTGSLWKSVRSGCRWVKDHPYQTGTFLLAAGLTAKMLLSGEAIDSSSVSPNFGVLEGAQGDAARDATEHATIESTGSILQLSRLTSGFVPSFLSEFRTSNIQV